MNDCTFTSLEEFNSSISTGSIEESLFEKNLIYFSKVLNLVLSKNNLHSIVIHLQNTKSPSLINPFIKLIKNSTFLENDTINCDILHLLNLHRTYNDFISDSDYTDFLITDLKINDLNLIFSHLSKVKNVSKIEDLIEIKKELFPKNKIEIPFVFSFKFDDNSIVPEFDFELVEENFIVDETFAFAYILSINKSKHKYSDIFLKYLLSKVGIRSLSEIIKLYNNYQNKEYIKDKIKSLVHKNSFINDLINSNLKIINHPETKETKSFDPNLDFNGLCLRFFNKNSKKLKKTIFKNAIEDKSFYYDVFYSSYIIKEKSLDLIYRLLDSKIHKRIILERPLSKEEENILSSIRVKFKDSLGFFNTSKKNIIQLIKMDLTYLLKTRCLNLDVPFKNIEEMIKVINENYNLIKKIGFSITDNPFKTNFDQYLIKSADTSNEVSAWGVKLNNCLVSDNWGFKLKSNESNLYGIFYNSEILWCIEVQKSKIIQFEGKLRRKPDPITYKIICQKLKELNICV